MQITIDTSRDSKEEIQKAIDFLRKFVEEKNIALGRTSGENEEDVFTHEPIQKTASKNKDADDNEGYEIIPY